jgi:hypothetical protein
MPQAQTGVTRWLELILAEYQEMPDLRLSKARMQRTVGIRPVHPAAGTRHA